MLYIKSMGTRLGIITLLLVFCSNLLIEIQAKCIKQHQNQLQLTTAERIKLSGYPVETHNVQTSDGYILQLFRIPYSKRVNNSRLKNKPIFYLQHGLLSSSDCWILNGVENSLAYLLADAGYEVWLGNFRGNTYSHTHIKLQANTATFWDFSFHQMAIYDLPISIDYILHETKQKSLHYVGHSQGTTTFFILQSLKPEYYSKMKTVHLLAPVVYMNHMKSPFAAILGPVIGIPTELTALIGRTEFMPSSKLIALLGDIFCTNKSPIQQLCSNILFLIGGWDSKHLNTTILPSILETHPAGSSALQLTHYLQEYLTGTFSQYNYGIFENLNKYQQLTPPEYPLNKLKTKLPIELYYSDNDYFASVADVKHLALVMGSKVNLNHIKYSDWNHLDFLWANEVKPLINDKIIAKANIYENKI